MVELAWEVARHLPYLRRYARAILGDREQGDANVRACLESLLPRAGDLAGGDLKVQLYRALHGVWGRDGRAVPEHEPVPPLMENQTIVAARVGHLSPTKRQILMLTVLEGFTLPDAAEVMGLSLAAAEALLGQAKEELRAQRASRILIIEDEPIIALDIATTVQQSGHTVVGIAATHRDAVALAEREGPELILADIQLADESSGLEAVQEILRERYVPVVFITAFPERLLTGTRPEPTFLITKPFDAETLRVSISQVLAAAIVTADERSPAIVQ
jgi:CheY-like chemotaxis protein/DNA-directed RNA polymerase specialized sigma24 family protein